MISYLYHLSILQIDDIVDRFSTNDPLLSLVWSAPPSNYFMSIFFLPPISAQV